jgi:hypothetical protein
MATRATAPNEVVVQIIPAGNTPSQKPELLTEDLEEQLHVDQTRKQKIVLAALYTVVALEGLYMFVFTVKYVADWFILLLVVTRKLTRVR